MQFGTRVSRKEDFMAERNIDKLLSMTDSKYKLSVAIAKRAIQLKSGVVPVVPPEQRVGTRNLVTLAMREFASGGLITGDEIVDEAKLQTLLDRTRAAQHEANQAAQAVSYQMPDFDGD
jgi:DNA-directed RNA polymerase subunit omega